MRPLFQFLRALGYRIISYVDDFGGAQPSRCGQPATTTDVQRVSELVLLVCAALGLWLHPNKGSQDGSTAVQLQGYVVDSTHNVYRLQAARAITTQAQAAALLHCSTTHARWVRFSALRIFL